LLTTLWSIIQKRCCLLALILFVGLQVEEVFQFHVITHHSEFNFLKFGDILKFVNIRESLISQNSNSQSLADVKGWQGVAADTWSGNPES